MTKTKKIVYYVLLVLVSVMFAFAAYSKLMAGPEEAAEFAKFHLPMWFMYFIGVAELAGAIGLWIPKLQKWAVWGLQIIMVGAVVVTVMFDSVTMAIAPAVFGVILYFIMKMGAEAHAGLPMVVPGQNAGPTA